MYIFVGCVVMENVELMFEVEFEFFDVFGILVVIYIIDCDGLFIFNDLNDGEIYIISM